jgi:hypothetical protein
MQSATLIAPPELCTPPGAHPSTRTHDCPECGHVLRVSGLGRHRVYFELDDERSNEPVINHACPACGHALPAKGLR